MSQVGIIIGREFNERVRKKSFIITTLLMPLLMVALMAAPALIMQFSRGDEKRIAVIDESGLVAPRLESDEELRFEPTDLTTEEARRTLTDRFGVLRIGGDILENPSDVKLYANSSSSLSVESSITDQIERILEAEKLKRYNIDNLQQILDEVKTTVTLQTFRNDKSQEEETHAQSSTVATVTGYVLGFILYMFLLIYGQMVMQSVIEEKNNRVLEVMVSSVRPFDLMMGKILGIASVAVVQVAIWGVLICGIGAAVMPHLMPSDVMASAQAMQQGMPDAAAASGMDPEMLQAVAAITDLGYIVRIFVCLLLFVFGGYLFGHVRRRGFGRGQRAGRFATTDAHHAADHPRAADDVRRHPGPQLADGLLVLGDSLHVAHRHDRPHPLRHSALGDRPFARGALRLVRGDGVVRREDLPRGHLHVRQETDARGAVQVGAVQILTAAGPGNPAGTAPGRGRGGLPPFFLLGK